MTEPSGIRVRWSAGERTFPARTAVRIGRDADCDIVLRGGVVSRRHGVLQHGPGGWTYQDSGSTAGSFCNGAPVTSMLVDRAVTIVLGRGDEAESLEVAPELAVPAGPTTLDNPSRGMETVLPRGPARPGGALRSQALQEGTVISGEVLRVECAGESYVFSPGVTVRVGRDPDADIPTVNPTVSRQHASLRHDGTGWNFEDAGSASGTFLDGRRVSTVPIRGSMAFWLGAPDTGERLVAVASGERSRSVGDRVGRAIKARPLLFAGAAALVLVLLAAAVLVPLLKGGGGEPDNDVLARATVRLTLDDGSHGSGTIVDAERGLILTNAHVAAPRALGQGVYQDVGESELPKNPTSIEIAVASGLDEAVEPRFTGEVLAADGYLDLAIVRIAKTIGGKLVEPGDLDGLTALDIGSASDVKTGAAIRVFGYPGVSQSNTVTLSEGVVAGSVADDRLKSNRAFLNIDAAIKPGNSGGLAADSHGNLVGVPTLNRLEQNNGVTSTQASMRPADLAAPLLKAARAGKTYRSPWVVAATGEEKVTPQDLVPAGRTAFEASCDSTAEGIGAGDQVLGLTLNYTGFRATKHQDLRVQVVEAAQGDVVGEVTTAEQWPVVLGSSGCLTATVPLRAPLESGDYFIAIDGGPNYTRLAAPTFTVP